MGYQEEMHVFLQEQREYIKQMADTIETLACLTQGLLKVVHRVEGDDGILIVAKRALELASAVRFSDQAKPDKALIQRLCDEAKTAK